MSKRYLIALLFIGLLGLSVSCNKDTNTNNTQTLSNVEQQTQEKSQEKIISSFEVKVYSTPFIEFNYPASWIEQNLESKSSFISLSNKYDPDDKKNYIFLNGFLRQLDQSAIETRIAFANSFKGKDIEIIDDKTMLNNNIAVLEFIDWGKLKVRNKCYFYNNGNGKGYMINIYMDKDHWDKYQEVIKVFEQSLKFK